MKVVLSHPDLQQITINKVTDMLDAECSTLCKKDTATPSPFRKMAFDKMRRFNWNLLVKDLQAKAPVLFMFYTVVSHSDKRNQQKRDAAHHPAIHMAMATLLKDRNREMGGLQTIVSLLLFKSCVKKQVWLTAITQAIKKGCGERGYVSRCMLQRRWERRKIIK